MKNVLIFAAGAAIGSVVTWKLIEKKYKDLADEEIASVVETFKNRDKKKTTTKKKKETELKNEASVKSMIDGVKKLGTVIKEEEKVNYANIVNDNDYTSDEVKPEDVSNDKVPDEDCYIKVEPTDEEHVELYTIPPEEFGEGGLGWGTKSYTYYADGILADEVDAIEERQELVFGPNGMKGFGEYEPNTVYIRDEDNELDYEVIKESKTYSEIVGGDTD